MMILDNLKLEMRSNNSGKGKAKETAVSEVNVHSHSTDQLYAMAEGDYKRVSAGQQSRWSRIIGRGGTKKDKLTLMTTEILSNPHTSLEQF